MVKWACKSRIAVLCRSEKAVDFYGKIETLSEQMSVIRKKRKWVAAGDDGNVIESGMQLK